MDTMIKSIGINWDWVKAHTMAGEKISGIGDLSTRQALLDHLDEAVNIARSKAASKIFVVKIKILKFNPDSIELDGGVRLSAKELSSYIKGATDVYAFVVTIGGGVEEAASSYMGKGDHLLGYLLDRIGSFAVESLAKNTEDTLRRALALEGSSVSMRFSPGYCDWPIEEQFKLAKIIDFSKAGVILTENCMMIPKKSISAVVGVGAKELFSEVKSPCVLCNMKACNYRRVD